jgi:ABC-type multidrug transport system ATPase subunit
VEGGGSSALDVGGENGPGISPSAPGVRDSATLEVRDLCVRYRHSDTDAVSRASFAIGREKVVIVGPNGCGKTSLLKAALGLAPIRSGSVRVFGQDVAVVQGETGVGTNLAEVYRLMTLPVDRLISIWADLKGGPEDEVRGWIREFGLDPVLPHPLFRLSTGQMKLVGDLLALSFSPRLVLLDEPFDNVDFGRRRKYVTLLGRSPAAVVMNTHELDLLPAFPDWGLYFMFEGQLIGRFRAGDLDRLYVSRGARADALATFTTSIGEVSVTRDAGEVPIKGASNLSYLLDRIA